MIERYDGHNFNIQLDTGRSYYLSQCPNERAPKEEKKLLPAPVPQKQLWLAIEIYNMILFYGSSFVTSSQTVLSKPCSHAKLWSI